MAKHAHKRGMTNQVVESSAAVPVQIGDTGNGRDGESQRPANPNVNGQGSNLAVWLSAVRPKTLPASVAPVLVGVAAGYKGLITRGTCATSRPGVGGCVERSLVPSQGWAMFAALSALCAVVALFLQIAVNFANDYSDGIRGTDAGRGDAESQTSKPQRITASGLVAPKRVLTAALVNAAVACVAGLALIVMTGTYWLLLVGVACLLAGWFYTGGKHPYGYAGFGEVGVFVFFGLVAVLGTQYVLSGGISVDGVVGAVLCGLFSCSILMVNNLRDVKEDVVSGKMTLGVRLGEHRARTLLLVVYLASMACTVLMAFAPVLMARGEVWTVDLAGLVFTAIGFVVAVPCIKVAGAATQAVKKNDFVHALPGCSASVLLFSVMFVVVELAIVL